MGLDATIKAAAKQAFIAVDDVKVDITFKRVTTNTWNPTTQTKTKVTSDTALKAVLGKANKEAFDDEVRTTELRFTILQEDLPGVIPQQEDVVTYDSDDYILFNIEFDPSNTIWILEGRTTEQ